MYLLDVNVLIALLDPAHAHHTRAKIFFREILPGGWATCPTTENGLLRILGNSAYPGGPGSPSEARVLLESLVAMPGHQFWPDDQSLLDGKKFPTLPSAKHLTDIYLLALAVSRRASFATFDRAIEPSQIPGGREAYLLIS